MSHSRVQASGTYWERLPADCLMPRTPMLVLTFSVRTESIRVDAHRLEGVVIEYLVQYVTLLSISKHFAQDFVPGLLHTAQICTSFVVSDMVVGEEGDKGISERVFLSL
jgi:hypothetical protein